MERGLTRADWLELAARLPVEEAVDILVALMRVRIRWRDERFWIVVEVAA